MKSHVSLPASIAALALSLVLTGCESLRMTRTQAKQAANPAASFTPTTVADRPALDPALLQRPTAEYKLGPGDLLEIEVLGDIATRARTVVGPDGKIYFYILPGIDVWGLTLPQTREKIVEELKKLVREPQPISISLVTAESQRIWVLGRLNKPGVYTMTGPMTLLEAISSAGGPAPNSTSAALGGLVNASTSRGGSDEAADLSRAFVIRQGRLLRVDFQKLLREGDMSQNIYLQPDDFVYLPSSTVGSVHVLGAVQTPRAVEFINRLTVVQAVAQAGGTVVREAYPQQIAIVRGSLSQPKVAVVDMNAILGGKAADVILEPQDIVFVPYSPHRVLTRYLDTILDTFVRVVGVNEGARAVSDRALPTQVNVPLGPL
jgi:polysaccharide export outer membrane protein